MLTPEIDVRTVDEIPLADMAADMDHEEEPLFSNEPGTDRDYDTAPHDDLKQASRSSWYLFILTFGMGGLQVIWSVQHANGSPYLLSLGMSKALLACVWIAGPLTGTLVQPYIGALSDNCRSRWGRRRPFIAMGGVITVVCLLALAWVRELAGSLLRLFSADVTADAVKTTSIIGATVLMYCLDFAVNTVQAGLRAFIVDNAPWHQQKSANAWASRVIQAASIISYTFGCMDLPKIFPILGGTQFQVLAMLSSFSLTACLSISCFFIKEAQAHFPPKTAVDLRNKSSIGTIWRSARHVSPQIKKVFAIQFASWFGWFSFLFYVTTYIGQLYVDPIFDKNPGLSEGEIDRTWAEATRLATSAFFMNAVVSFAGSILLPLIVSAPSQGGEVFSSNRGFSQSFPQKPAFSTYWEKSQILLKRLRVPGLTLRRLWLMSHFLFAACMFSTLFISTPGAASVMAATVGIPWMITSWAPFAVIATELARSNIKRRNSGEVEEGVSRASQSVGGRSATGSGTSTGEAGVVLGLHNVFISFPQIVSSIVSSVIFKALQKPRGEPFDYSVAWVMRIGGCAALIAGFLTIPLQEQDL